MKFIITLQLLAGFLTLSNIAKADHTETLRPLEVNVLRAGVSSDEYVLVTFNNNSMRGCYQNSGGIIYKSREDFKEIYSLLLSIKMLGGRHAGTVWYQRTDNFGNENDDAACIITGVQLY